MSDTPSIKKNFAYNTIYQIVSFLLPFITTPYLSRRLGPDMLGIQSYTESIQSYFILAAVLGTSTYGTREIARHRNDEYERSKLFWEIELMTVFTSTIVLLAWILMIAISSKYQIFYLAMTPHILASMFDISWFYRGLEKFQHIVIPNILFLILGFLSMILFVKTRTDLLVYVIILSVTGLLTSLSLWRYLRQNTVSINFRQLTFKKHFRQTLFYFIPTIATSIYTVLDRTLLGLLTTDNTQNGYYLQAEKIISVIKSISYISINSVVGVRISFLFAEKKINEIKRRINSSLNYILFMSIGCACGVTVIAHNFVPLFLGNEFAIVEYVLYILSPIVIIIGISNCLESHYYTPSGHRAQSNRYLIIGAIVNLILNLILIPKLYVFGAAIASVIAETVITSLYVIKSNGYLPITLLMKYLWKKLLAGIIMIILIFPIGHRILHKNKIIIVIFQILTGFIVYISGLLILKDEWVITYIYKFFNKKKKCHKT